MTFDTGNPVPSKDPRDLVDNAEKMDEAVNGTGDSWTDRLGNERPTLKRLEDDYPQAGVDADRAEAAAADAEAAQAAAEDAQAEAETSETSAAGSASAAAASASSAATSASDAQTYAEAAASAGDTIYDDTTDGIGGTTEGDYFWVASAAEGELLILYQHAAGGVANPIGTSPNASAVESAASAAKLGADYVAGYASVLQLPDLEYMLCIEDADGILRVIEESTGGDFRSYGALNEDREIDSVLQLADYPEMVKCVVDASGDLRVVYRLDAAAGVYQYSEDSSETTSAPTEYVLFLMAGQSNAHGSSRDPENSPVPPANWAFYWNGASLSPLEDPWATASYGSAWPSFAIKFTELTGKGVILVDGATGGTAMAPAADIGNGYWGGAGGGLRENAVADLNACITHLRSASYAYQFGGVLWSQGERDAQSIDASTITKADYTSAWANFIAYMRGELGDFWPFVFSRTGSKDSGDTAGFQAIRDAQDSICAADQFVLMGFTGALNFPALGMMYDDLHYDQAGLNKMGEAMAQSCAQMSASTAIAI